MADTRSKRSSVPEQTDATWQAFVEATVDREPRDLLLKALAIRPMAGDALDLGCGAGNETLALLAARWRVMAVDAFPGAIDSTRTRAQSINALDRLALVCTPFSQFTPEPRSFDLIHAGFALPFVSEAEFDQFWRSLCQSLRPGGILACQLFGDRDEWNTPENHTMSFHSRHSVDELLRGLTVRHHDEVEQDGQTALGEAKHWHVHHMIAQAPA